MKIAVCSKHLYLRVLTLHDIQAFLILVALWAYSIGVCLPPFFGWGGYSAEGLLLTCSYDYLKEVNKSSLFRLRSRGVPI